MAKEHIEALKNLRDSLVEERRQLVATGFSEIGSRHEAVGEFIGLQQLIDVTERALEHESHLQRPEGKPSIRHSS